MPHWAHNKLPVEVKARYFELIRAGWKGAAAAREIGVSTSCGSLWFIDAGSMIIAEPARVSRRFLALDQRIAIADGLRAKQPVKRHASVYCAFLATTLARGGGRAMPRSRLAGPSAQPPRLWDRILLGIVAIAAIIMALLFRHDSNTSTLTLVLAGLAGLLSVLALLLPYLAGLSGSVGGVSLALSFAVAKPEGLSAQVGSLSGQIDPVSGKATVTASGRTALTEIARGPDVEYVVVNLGRGDQWLASRLLIFTTVLKQLRQIQCVVLTSAASADGRQRLMGLVAADDFRRALAWEYPWHEAALFTSWQAVSPINMPASSGPLRVASLDADVAEQLFNAYVSSIRTGVPGADAGEWTELQYGDWEHSPLLTDGSLRTVLGGSLDTRAIQQSRSRSQQLADVLSIEAPYVAVVDRDHRFVSLVDRQALLEELAVQTRSGSGESADTQ